MILEKEQIIVLEALAKNEELLNELYNLYAGKFPDFREFWLEIAKDELEHASWIRALYSKIKEGSLSFSKDRLKKEAIEAYSKYVKDEINSISKEKISLKEALLTTLEVEKALIEREYFKVFDTDLLTLRQVLLNLDFATHEHIKRVEKVWAENK